MPRSELVQSLLRGLDILRLLGEAERGIRVVDVAGLLAVKPPTAHNLLRTLAHRGFVEQNGMRYRLGAAVLELAEAQANRQFLLRASVAIMAVSRHFAAATVTLGELMGTDVAVRLRVSPDRPGVLQKPRERTFPLYTTASGLLAQAYVAGDQLQAIRERHPFWEQDIQAWQDLDALEEYLGKVRKVGYCEHPFGRDEALRIATPLFGAGNEFCAVLGLNIPVRAMAGQRRKDIIKAVQGIANDLSQKAVVAMEMESGKRRSRSAERKSG